MDYALFIRKTNIVELRHIRYFLAVAMELNFSRAAEVLGIAQPPLSQQIRVLEDEVGTRLFRRLPRGVALTPAGEAFLRCVHVVPGQVNEGVRLARKAAAGESGTIRIGFTGTAALNPAVSRSISRFRHHYPDVEIQITEANSVALAAALVENTIDVAILRPSDEDQGLLSQEMLAEEPLIAVLPVSHHLADQAMIDLAALSADPFILTPRSVATSLHDAVLGACGREGFMPKMGPHAPHIASILSLVAAEFGVSLVPASVRQVGLQGISFVDLRNSTHQVSIAIAFQRGSTSALVRNFVASTRQ